MKYFFEEYGGVIVSGIVSMLIAMFFFTNLYPTVTKGMSQKIENVVDPHPQSFSSNIHTPILIVQSALINQNEYFDFHNYCRGYNYKGEDISNKIELYKGSVNVNVKGKYEVMFRLKDEGISIYKKAIYYVEEP